VHAIEAYVSKGSGPLTDTYALDAIKLIYENLGPLLSDPGDRVRREKIMLGSMKAGLAFSNAILGAVHAMAHSLGGFLDLAHGECNAMLLDHVVNFNFDAVPEKYTHIAQALNIDTRGMNSSEIKKRLLETIRAFKHSVGITRQLNAMGVKTTDITVLSKKAIKDACMLTNPRKVTHRDIEVIFEEAM
jgi:alcohol dehydrogenase class IV